MRIFTELLTAAALAATAGWAATCTTTSLADPVTGVPLTAAERNPNFTGDLDASGCDIGVFVDSGSGVIQNATIHGAKYFGVAVISRADAVSVSVLNSAIHHIGDRKFSGNPYGMAVFYRSYGSGTITGSVAGNVISSYQLNGIYAKGPGITVTIEDNKVTGLGPVRFPQNGIEVAGGANATVQRNSISDNSYTRSDTVSCGIAVVGGPYYGSPYTVGTRISGNTVVNNNVGIYMDNAPLEGGAPPEATNVGAVNNIATSDSYIGKGYQAGISDVGNNDKIINNTISGAGYDPATKPGSTFAIDADPATSTRPKVHANDY